MAALQAAFHSGDPEAIRAADVKVIAFGLRQMAELRMVEGSFPQAIELYRQSIDFEDLPQSHLRLALTYLQVKKPDSAMEEAEKARFSDPENPLAWRLEGSAFMQRKDYKKAAEALAHSLKLKGDPETAYNLGLCFLADHNPQRAKLVFSDIVRNAGDSAEVHLMLGRAYRDEEYYDDADREFRRAIAIDPKTPHSHYYLGLLILIRNQWSPTAEARELILDELKLNPNDAVSNYLAGMFAAGDHKYDASDRYLRLAANSFPDWPEPPLYMGLNAYGRGDYKNAELLLRQAITLTGKDEARGAYQIRRAYITLGRILLLTGRKEQSESYFKKSRELLDTALASSQQQVASIISSEGGSVGMGAVMPLVQKKQEEQTEADTYFGNPADHIDVKSLDKLPPEQRQQAETEENYLRKILGSSFNDVGTSDAREQKFVQALKDFQQAERWNPQIPGLERNLGVAAFKVGNYSEAARTLSPIVNANPQDAPARAMLGLSYFSSQDFKDAAKTLVQLGDSALNDPGLGYPYAASLAKSGQFKPAGEVLTRLEQQQSPADTLLLIGQTWSEIGDYAHSIDTLHRALALNPGLPRAHLVAGLACINADHMADAEKEFKAELAVDPANVEAKYHLAYVYLLESQPDVAEPLLREVIAADPQHADAQYQMGKVMLEKGKVQEAVPYLEQAERLSPDKDYVHYQLQTAYRRESRLQDADRELQLYKEAKARKREQTLPQPSQPNQN
ncbi:MAG TPA: tetratricopeptide repeat protein [Terriglobales bacterium]|nr:tetratricopeptide repeat protein [Terriglobales bacterium]